VNLLDLIVLLAAVGGAVVGYRLGFVVRAFSWLGFWVGFWIGMTLAPAIVEQMHESSDTAKVLVQLATLVGFAFVGQGLGMALGTRLHIAVPEGRARQVDRGAGAALSVLGVLAVLWLLLPALGSTPGWASEQARGSRIARELNDLMPDPPDPIRDLRRLMGEEIFPQVFDAMTPAPDVGPPPASAGLSAEQVQALVRSTVKVEGIACDNIQEGSGFVVGDDLVATNAHVVAGEDETQIEFDDGNGPLDAVVVAYDPVRDVAILRVANLDESQHPVLPRRGAEVRDTGGVFGHPGGNPLEISPFTVSDQITALGTDVYDRQRSEREVLVLSSQLQPGDSGSAVVDTEGTVIGIAFAVAPDDPDVAYALDLTELDAVLRTDLASPDDTGDCLV
jgi:S1-C subfamily serine protease